MLKKANQVSFKLTKAIKKEIENLLIEGAEPQEMMYILSEAGIIDEEYPELFDQQGNFDDSLEAMIEQAVNIECERLLDRAH